MFCRITEAQKAVYKHFLSSKDVKDLLNDRMARSTSLQSITILKKLCNRMSASQLPFLSSLLRTALKVLVALSPIRYSAQKGGGTEEATNNIPKRPIALETHTLPNAIPLSRGAWRSAW